MSEEKKATLLAGELKDIVRNIELSARAANHYLAMYGVGAYSPVKLADDLKGILSCTLVRLNELTGTTNNQLSNDYVASIIQRLNDLEHAMAGANSAMACEFSALAKDVAALRENVEQATGCTLAPGRTGVTYSVKLHINSDNADVDEIKNAVTGATMQAVEKIDSELRTAEPFNLLRTGNIYVNDAPITGGHFTGSVDAKSLVGHSPFKFALDSFVAIANTAFDGRITARAEHLKGSNSYLVVYQPADGLLAESWINENELSALPFDPD